MKTNVVMDSANGISNVVVIPKPDHFRGIRLEHLLPLDAESVSETHPASAAGCRRSD
jgi:hypothetical protein